MKIWVDKNPYVPRGWSHAKNTTDVERLFAKGEEVTDVSLSARQLQSTVVKVYTSYDIIHWMSINGKWPTWCLNIHDTGGPSSGTERFATAHDLYKQVVEKAPIHPLDLSAALAFKYADEGMQLNDRLRWFIDKFNGCGPVSLPHAIETLVWKGSYDATYEDVIHYMNGENIYRCAAFNRDLSHLLIYKQMDSELYLVSFDQFYKGQTGSFPLNPIYSEPDFNFTMCEKAHVVAEMLSNIDQWTWFDNPDLEKVSELYRSAKLHLDRLIEFKYKETVRTEIKRVQENMPAPSVKYHEVFQTEIWHAISGRNDITEMMESLNASLWAYYIVSTRGNKYYTLGGNLGDKPVDTVRRHNRISNIAQIFASQAAYSCNFTEPSVWEPLIEIWGYGYYPALVNVENKFVIYNCSKGDTDEDLA